MLPLLRKSSTLGLPYQSHSLLVDRREIPIEAAEARGGKVHVTLASLI